MVIMRMVMVPTHNNNGKNDDISSDTDNKNDNDYNKDNNENHDTESGPWGCLGLLGPIGQYQKHANRIEKVPLGSKNGAHEAQIWTWR